MKLALLPSLIAFSLLAAPIAFAPGCGSDPPAETTGTAGTGGTGGSGGSGGAGGATTSSTTEANVQCTALCDHLASIDCNVLQNCLEDCDNHLNAPEGCTEQADALIACWVEHKEEFECTMQQVLPPASCNEEETVFNTCVNGGMIDTSCICSNGVGVGDMETNCSRKTTCGANTYTQVCQKLEEGMPWTCSCFSNGGLLGTCSEDAANEHCSNMYGCCVPLFCSGGSEG